MLSAKSPEESSILKLILERLRLPVIGILRKRDTAPDCKINTIKEG
jgi:hypothetical protein